MLAIEGISCIEGKMKNILPPFTARLFDGKKNNKKSIRCNRWIFLEVIVHFL
jgi:hypothetical protein